MYVVGARTYLVVVPKTTLSFSWFFVVREAFGGRCWCDDVSRRKAEIDVVDFLVFDGKVEIDNVNFGLRSGTFQY